MKHIWNKFFKLHFYASFPNNAGFYYYCNHILISRSYVTPWRNGRASDSRSEGCVFESRRGQDQSAGEKRLGLEGFRNAINVVSKFENEKGL